MDDSSFKQKVELLKKEQNRKIEEIKNSYKNELKQFKIQLKLEMDEYNKNKEEIKKIKSQIFQQNNQTFMIRLKYSKQIQDQKEENNKLKEEIRITNKKLNEIIPRLEQNNSYLKNCIMSLCLTIKKISTERTLQQEKMETIKVYLQQYRDDLSKLNKYLQKPAELRSELINLYRKHVLIEEKKISEKSERENSENKRINRIIRHEKEYKETRSRKDISVEDLFELIKKEKLPDYCPLFIYMNPRERCFYHVINPFLNASKINILCLDGEGRKEQLMKDDNEHQDVKTTEKVEKQGEND